MARELIRLANKAHHDEPLIYGDLMLAQFVPWNASPEDLRTCSQPPPTRATPDQ